MFGLWESPVSSWVSAAIVTELSFDIQYVKGNGVAHKTTLCLRDILQGRIWGLVFKLLWWQAHSSSSLSVCLSWSPSLSLFAHFSCFLLTSKE